MEISNNSIAILLATYNGETYLKEQIDSLLAQTYQDWHLYVHDDGSYGPNKHDMYLEQWDHVLENDEDFKYHKNSYAGWWYCCIPVKKIDRSHLPIPLFIRGDDVEFSLANNAEFLSLNGICIWHKGFANKFNANLELYMVHRNSLIIQAMSGICKGIDFMERIDGFFWKELKRLSYNNGLSVEGSISSRVTI